MATKQERLEYLWAEMQRVSRAMEKELPEIRKREGKPTQAYLNLKKDMATLKEEYETLKGGGTYDPMNPKHGEKVSTRSFVDKVLGKKGPDSHFNLND